MRRRIVAYRRVVLDLCVCSQLNPGGDERVGERDASAQEHFVMGAVMARRWTTVMGANRGRSGDAKGSAGIPGPRW